MRGPLSPGPGGTTTRTGTFGMSDPPAYPAWEKSGTRFPHGSASYTRRPSGLGYTNRRAGSAPGAGEPTAMAARTRRVVLLIDAGSARAPTAPAREKAPGPLAIVLRSQ